MSPLYRFVWLAVVVVTTSNVALKSQDPATELRNSLARNWREADAIVERYLHVQGLDRPTKEVFPRESAHEVSEGGTAVVLKIRFLRGEKGVYRLEVEPKGQPRYTEGCNSPGSFWLVGEVAGIGKPIEQSDLAKAMFRMRWDAGFIRNNYVSRRKLPDAVIGGKTFNIVAMEQIHGKNWEFWCFDPETGALERVEFSLDGKHPEAAVQFTEFKLIDGALEPMLTIHGAGAKRTEFRTVAIENRVKVQTQLIGGDFAMPSAESKEWNKTDEILAKYVKASGGGLNLGKIVSRVTKFKCEVSTTGVKYEMTLSQKLPDWILLENNVAGIGQSWQGYNGRTGWASSELQGYRTLRGDELQLFIRSSDLHNAGDFGRVFNIRKLIGSKIHAGRAAVAVALGTARGPAGTHIFDQETGQLVGLESVMALEGGGTMPVTIEFSDYRAVDGVMLPFATSVTNPAMRLVTTIDSVQHNLELSDSLFDPRKEP